MLVRWISPYANSTFFALNFWCLIMYRLYRIVQFTKMRQLDHLVTHLIGCFFSSFCPTLLLYAGRQ
ncbi:hypothetical protein B9Z19DRAFT_1086406 [Tuber borchii]|uniref:Uncharacterized protein n=1 Tax=Tuber borchii TaxID=42251 RepID=A0A2T6ZPL1_TUBBO|nr:hypothetical protein B9Z19DRAFT_1086406 [Tuber borchii]